MSLQVVFGSTNIRPVTLCQLVAEPRVGMILRAIHFSDGSGFLEAQSAEIGEGNITFVRAVEIHYNDQEGFFITDSSCHRLDEQETQREVRER